VRTRRLPDRILNQRGEECRQQISPWVSTQGRVYYGLGPDSDGQSTGVLCEEVRSSMLTSPSRLNAR